MAGDTRGEGPAYIDKRRTVPLDDVGLSGYLAAVLVDSEGDEDMLLVDAAAAYRTSYSTDAPPVHERTGPLPALWASRIRLAPLRCGRTTRAGRRCRCIVLRPGVPCARHQSTDSDRSSRKGNR